MPEILASVLQVSFSARKKGEQYEECVQQWLPLLKALGAKGGRSVSEIISDALVSWLPSMKGSEWLTSEELSALELASNNDEMGSSLIETKLDDTVLAHCFSFLDIKDVCTSIERTSHRFLQVSRNRKRPFFQNDMIWDPFDDQSALHTPFDRLISPLSGRPTPITVRSLRRFKISFLSFEPHMIDQGPSDCVQFADVLRVIHEGLEVCLMDTFTMGAHYYPLPPDLFRVPKVIIDGVLRSTMFQELCVGFSQCRSLRINQARLDSPQDWTVLSKLTNLRELTIWEAAYIDNDENEKDVDLNADSLPLLTNVSLVPYMLPHFSSLMTPNIRSLRLNGFSQLNAPLDTIHFKGELTNLESLELAGICRSSDSSTLKTRLCLPKRIPKMTLRSDWQFLSDWVSIADEMHFALWNRRGQLDGSYYDPSVIASDILSEWRLNKCSIAMSDPKLSDIQITYEIVKNADDHTAFHIQLFKFDSSIQGLQNQTDKLKSIMDSRIPKSDIVVLKKFDIGVMNE